MIAVFLLQFSHKWDSTPRTGRNKPQKTCKRHLREKYRDMGELVEEFIAEFEGSGKNADLTR